MNRRRTVYFVFIFALLICMHFRWKNGGNNTDAIKITNNLNYKFNAKTVFFSTPKNSVYGSPRIIPYIPDGIILNSQMMPAIHQHEDGVKPNGVSNDTPWKYGTIVRDEIKSNWSRIGLWGQVYLQEGYLNLPQNTGIQLKNLQMYILNPKTLCWELLFDVLFGDSNTLFYDDNYNYNYSQQFYSHKKIHNNGKTVTIKFDEQNKDFNFHPYSNERFDFKLNDYVMDDGRPYIISTMEARLVKWNENGIDDLDQAEVIFNVGGDYWDTYENEWKPDWSANGEIGGGQFIKISRNWRKAWFTNVPYDLCDVLIPDSFRSIYVGIDEE